MVKHLCAHTSGGKRQNKTASLFYLKNFSKFSRKSARKRVSMQHAACSSKPSKITETKKLLLRANVCLEGTKSRAEWRTYTHSHPWTVRFFASQVFWLHIHFGMRISIAGAAVEAFNISCLLQGAWSGEGRGYLHDCVTPNFNCICFLFGVNLFVQILSLFLPVSVICTPLRCFAPFCIACLLGCLAGCGRNFFRNFQPTEAEKYHNHITRS